MKTGTAPVNIPHQSGLIRWTSPTFPARHHVCDSTAHHCDFIPAQTVLLKSYLHYCQIKLNSFYQQQISAAVSSPMSHEILLTQLMRTLWARQRPGYLEFLQRYAAEHATGLITPTIDYLDHIRQNAAEDFRQNGIEVLVMNNDADRNNKGQRESRATNNIADVGMKFCCGRINKKRGNNSINTSETYQFTSTSLSNHEAVDDRTDSYKDTRTNDFYIPKNSKKNSFRLIKSQRYLNRYKKPEIFKRDQCFPSLQSKRPRHVGQYYNQSLHNGINSDLVKNSYKRDPLGSCGSNLETDCLVNSKE